MADEITFDFSELTELVADLGAAPAEAVPAVGSALQYTANRIKRGAAAKVRSRRHFKQAAAAIDYELTGFSGFGANVIAVEIGYDKHRPAGALGNLIEFGAPGSLNALTPGGELITTLHQEQPDFVKGLGKALDDAHKRVGL